QLIDVAVQFNAGSTGSLTNCSLSYPSSSPGIAVAIFDASPTVQNCTITTPNAGIWIDGSQQVMPAAPLISGNSITAQFGSNGITVRGTAQPTIQSNVLAAAGTGIFVGGAAVATVQDNTVTTDRIGIDCAENAQVTVTGNTISFQAFGDSGRLGVQI